MRSLLRHSFPWLTSLPSESKATIYPSILAETVLVVSTPDAFHAITSTYHTTKSPVMGSGRLLRSCLFLVQVRAAVDGKDASGGFAAGGGEVSISRQRRQAVCIDTPQ